MPVPFSENGGFAATNFYLFVPVQTTDGNVYIGIFDPSSFDDPVDGSSYSYRQEDVQPGRVPAIRRVIVIYRDIGAATLVVTISGVNDNGNLVSAQSTLSIGTPAATGSILTIFADIAIAAFRPQLSWMRANGSGPVSIVSATMIGELEETSL